MARLYRSVARLLLLSLLVPVLLLLLLDELLSLHFKAGRSNRSLGGPAASTRPAETSPFR